MLVQEHPQTRVGVHSAKQETNDLKMETEMKKPNALCGESTAEVIYLLTSPFIPLAMLRNFLQSWKIH